MNPEHPMYVVDGKLTYDYVGIGRPTAPTVTTLVSGINPAEVQVSVDGYSNREIGFFERYRNSGNYLLFMYDPKITDAGSGGAMTPCGEGGVWYWFTTPPSPWSGNYYGTRTPAYPTDQPVPIRLTVSMIGPNVFYTVTDGTTTYDSAHLCNCLGPAVPDGSMPPSGGVGLAGDHSYSRVVCGETILPALYDNFVVEVPAAARSVAADSVQVIVPGSVVPPDLQVGDFVKVVGIAGNGLAVEGIRAVTVRQSDDLRKTSE
jgi:hypothetical protein